MTRLLIVLVWLLSACFASKIASPAHGRSQSSSSGSLHSGNAPDEDHPNCNGFGCHHMSPVQFLPSPRPISNPRPNTGDSAPAPQHPGSAGPGSSTIQQQSGPRRDPNDSRSGLVLSPRAPTFEQISAQLEQFWSGSSVKEAARRNLVFWVGKKRMIPRSGGFSYSTDANQVQATDFTNRISQSGRKYYTLNMLRGAYTQSWTDSDLDWYEQEAMFDRLSAAMATFVKDEAIVFGSPEGFARTGTAWSDIEYPILLKKGVTIRWYWMDGDNIESSTEQPKFPNKVFVPPKPPPGKSKVKSPPVSRPLEKNNPVPRPRIKFTGPIRGESDRPVQPARDETQTSPPPQNPIVPSRGGHTKQQPTGSNPNSRPSQVGAQGTPPLKPSTGTRDGRKPKTQPQQPVSLQPEQSLPWYGRQSGVESQTGITQQLGSQPPTKPPSGPQPLSGKRPQLDNPYKHNRQPDQPSKPGQVASEIQGSSEGHSALRGTSTNEGQRGIGWSGASQAGPESKSNRKSEATRASGINRGGGTNRGDRKSSSTPTTAKFMMNVGQKQSKDSTTLVDNSAGVIDDFPRMAGDGISVSSTKERSVYDRFSYPALDDMYLRLKFAEMFMTEDALFGESDLMHLFGSLSVL